MFRWFLRLVGRRAVRQAVAPRGGTPLLDLKLGLALFRARHVPTTSKLAALVLGVAISAAIVALELPLEALVAALLNLPGLGLDVMIDGLEGVLGPILIAAALLPRLAPRAAERLMAEAPSNVRHRKPAGLP